MEISKHVLPYLFLTLFIAKIHDTRSENTTIPFHVGVILDLGTLVGKMGRTSISMAIEDFYLRNQNYTTRIVLHTRDSENDAVKAAASGT